MVWLIYTSIKPCAWACRTFTLRTVGRQTPSGTSFTPIKLVRKAKLTLLFVVGQFKKRRILPVQFSAAFSALARRAITRKTSATASLRSVFWKFSKIRSMLGSKWLAIKNAFAAFSFTWQETFSFRLFSLYHNANGLSLICVWMLLWRICKAGTSETFHDDAPRRTSVFSLYLVSFRLPFYRIYSAAT